MGRDRVAGSGRSISPEAFSINAEADRIAQEAYSRIRDLYGADLPAIISFSVHSFIAHFADMPPGDRKTLVDLLDKFVAPYRSETLTESDIGGIN